MHNHIFVCSKIMCFEMGLLLPHEEGSDSLPDCPTVIGKLLLGFTSTAAEPSFVRREDPGLCSDGYRSVTRLTPVEPNGW
jgi:hypothetical protein